MSPPEGGPTRRTYGRFAFTRIAAPGDVRLKADLQGGPTSVGSRSREHFHRDPIVRLKADLQDETTQTGEKMRANYNTHSLGTRLVKQATMVHFHGR